MQSVNRVSVPALKAEHVGKRKETEMSKEQEYETGGGGRSPQEGAEISCCFDVGIAKADTPTLCHYTTQLAHMQLRTFTRLGVEGCRTRELPKR